LLDELADAVAAGTLKQFMETLPTALPLIIKDFVMRKQPLTHAPLRTLQHAARSMTGKRDASKRLALCFRSDAGDAMGSLSRPETSGVFVGQWRRLGSLPTGVALRILRHTFRARFPESASSSMAGWQLDARSGGTVLRRTAEPQCMAQAAA
jgi:hypothetical protein